MNHLRPSRIRKILRLAFLAIFFPVQSVFSQAYSTDLFNEENGLPERFIYTVTQDENGFLWLGTASGLYRFDGQKFTHFTKDDANGPVEDFTTTSLRDSKNRTWFGHFEGGLTLLDGTDFERIFDKVVFNSSVTGIQEDSKGNIWLSSQRNGIAMLNEDFDIQHFQSQFSEIVIVSFAITPDDQLLIGTDEGLKVYRLDAKGQVQFSHDVTDIPLTLVQCISPRSHRRGFWIGTEDEGLFEFNPGKNPQGDSVLQFSTAQGFPVDNIKCIYEDESENVWIGTFGRGILKFADIDVSSRMQQMTPAAISDSSSKDIIHCIFGDKFGQVWLGTYGAGLVCLAEEVFTNYTLNDPENPSKEVFCSLEDYEGNFWFGTANGLYMVNGSRSLDNGFQYTMENVLQLPYHRKYTTEDGLTSNYITALHEDEQHALWIGTQKDGLCRMSLDREKIVSVDLKGVSLAKSINAVNGDTAGNIWVATTDGAFLHRNDSTATTRYYSTRNGLAHNNIYDIYPDSKGQVWFATHTNNVTLYDGNEFKPMMVRVTTEVPNINCITEDREGNIWLGTDGTGIYRYDGKDFVKFDEEDGMVSNYVYHLTIDENGDIWCGHRDGLSRFVPDTEKFIAYPNKQYHSYEENPLHHAMLDSHGNIWYSTSLGLIRYNWLPARNRMEEPYTFIQSFSLSGVKQLLKDSLTFSYDSYSANFEFLGLTFLQQSSVLYQHRLIGRAPEWSEPNSLNYANFQSLEPGQYTFMVRACNAVGVCNEEPATITFTITEPFWNTWWFRLLILLALAAAIYFFIKYREYRFEKEKADLEAKVTDRTIELQEQKEKIEQANLELEKLSLVARETDNAVFILDPEGNLEWINHGFTRLTGYTYPEVVEMRKSRNFLETSSNPEIRNLLDSVVKSNSSVSYESQLPSKKGKDPIWVVSTLTPILDEAGQLRKIVIIDSDISERKKAEQQVREINSKLEALVTERTQELKVAITQLQQENADHVETSERLRIINQELDNFVYRASHDLKGPLASMMGLVDIAKGDLESNAVAIRYLTLMEKAGARLDNILVDLIEATQVKQGVIQFSKIKVKLLVEEIVESMKNRKDFRDVEFRLEIDPEMEIVSDRKLMISILQNFIDNSVKYRDESKPQAISWINIALQSDNIIDIKVRDNGIGIKDELKNKVFDMFFRGTSQAGGSGLGLYIVKQAAEKLKGTIDMESEFQVGTTFMAFIPNRKESEIFVPEETVNPNDGFFLAN